MYAVSLAAFADYKIAVLETCTFPCDRLYIRVSGLCLTPEHPPSSHNIITSLSLYFVNPKHRSPNYFMYLNPWTPPTQAQPSISCGSQVGLSELCLALAHWAACSSTLGRGAGGGGGRVFGLESQWGRVNAVAFPCGSWSIVKQVSQMSSTLKHSRKDWYAAFWQSMKQSSWATWAATLFVFCSNRVVHFSCITLLLLVSPKPLVLLEGIGGIEAMGLDIRGGHGQTPQATCGLLDLPPQNHMSPRPTWRTSYCRYYVKGVVH